MKKRDKGTISADMQKIGILKALSDSIAEGSKLSETKASDFADYNEDMVSLTNAQEFKLLGIIVPDYEAIVRRNVHVHLTQHEFDALVSFVFNPGETFIPISHAINKGNVLEAMNIIKTRIITGHKKSSGLLHRRIDEIQLYLHGAYHRHFHRR